MGSSGNFKKRLDRLEERAGHYIEAMDDRNDDDDELTRMFNAVGPRGLAKILKAIDGKTRGLPIDRE